MKIFDFYIAILSAFLKNNKLKGMIAISGSSSMIIPWYIIAPIFRLINKGHPLFFISFIQMILLAFAIIYLHNKYLIKLVIKRYEAIRVIQNKINPIFSFLVFLIFMIVGLLTFTESIEYILGPR